MKLMKINKVIGLEINSNSNKEKIYSLYDIYNLLIEKKLNKKELSKKESKKLDIFTYLKNDSNNQDEGNFILNKILNFENEYSFMNMNKFQLLWEFEYEIDKKNFQVFFGNMKEYDYIIDFALYEITNIKEEERINAEN